MLFICRHVVQEKQDIKQAMEFMHQCPRYLRYSPACKASFNKSRFPSPEIRSSFHLDTDTPRPFPAFSTCSK
jgi:hypothetical protein